MARHRTFYESLGILLLGVSACGDENAADTTTTTTATTTTSTSSTSSTTNECDVPDDCPGQDTTCASRTCDAGVCGVSNAAADTPCTDGGGAMCDGDGVCVECLDGADCGANETCQAHVCVATQCFNGVVDGDETDTDCGGPTCNPCDAGDTCVEGGDCTSGVCDGTCQAPTCGDGVVNDPSEVCDSGGEAANCDDDCTAVACGDGNLNAAAGEGCDDGDGLNSDSCPDGANGTCQAAACGDGFVWNTDGGGESCDDGDGLDGDSCPDGANGTCQAATCGDGIVWNTDGGAETCDDGNGSDADSCPDGANGTCQAATCGDGIVWDTDGGTESCDDGNGSDADSCPDGVLGTCEAATCGDGIVWDTDGGAESCDDKNGVTGDGCGACQSVVAVAAGGAHTCALLSDGRVKCWGLNSSGQLGLGDAVNRGDQANQMGANLPTVDLGTGRTAMALAAGGQHTCAILDDDSLKCWGLNSSGQLGLGGTGAQGDGPLEMGDALATVNLGTGRKAVHITAGGAHTCAMLDNLTVKCWGLNSSGQLGIGTTDNRGDAPAEMGDALPIVLYAFLVPPAEVAAGGNHTCIRFAGGQVKCWGANSSGQLGLEDTNNRGDAPGEMGSSLPFVDLGTNLSAASIAAGSTHTCAILNNDTLKCWGQNANGQLGLGTVDNRGDAAGEMGDALPFVGLGSGRSPVQLALGSQFSCAILDNDGVKCWGAGGSGRLGYGDTNNRGDGANEMGDSLNFVALGTGRTAVALRTSNASPCVLLDDDTLKCWGANGSGQLGLGNVADRGDNAFEMGDFLPTLLLP